MTWRRAGLTLVALTGALIMALFVLNILRSPL